MGSLPWPSSFLMHLRAQIHTCEVHKKKISGFWYWCYFVASFWHSLHCFEHRCWLRRTTFRKGSTLRFEQVVATPSLQQVLTCLPRGEGRVHGLIAALAMMKANLYRGAVFVINKCEKGGNFPGIGLFCYIMWYFLNARKSSMFVRWIPLHDWKNALRCTTPTFIAHIQWQVFLGGSLPKWAANLRLPPGVFCCVGKICSWYLFWASSQLYQPDNILPEKVLL